FGRPKNTQPFLVKGIHDSLGQRILRTDDCQPDFLFFGKANETLEVGGFNWNIDSVLGCAGVAGRAEDLFDARRLSQLPHKGVLPPALTDYQYLHGSAPAP